MRELKEDPFERIRLVADKIRKTPLRAIGAERISAFELTPDSVVELWFERLVANGIKQLRISDPANDPAGWRKSVSRAKRNGLGTVLNAIVVGVGGMGMNNMKALFGENIVAICDIDDALADAQGGPGQGALGDMGAHLIDHPF